MVLSILQCTGQPHRREPPDQVSAPLQPKKLVCHWVFFLPALGLHHVCVGFSLVAARQG